MANESDKLQRFILGNAEKYIRNDGDPIADNVEVELSENRPKKRKTGEHEQRAYRPLRRGVNGGFHQLEVSGQKRELVREPRLGIEFMPRVPCRL